MPPTYDYECKECGHKVEIFHSMSDPTKRECPKCNGELQKLISGGCGVIFKGAGFYVNDYKRKT